MSHARLVITFLCLSYAESSVTFYQQQINSLSRNVTADLQHFRSSHHAQLATFLRRSLDSIGRHTSLGRARTAESLEYIGSVSDSHCGEQALAEQRMYARIMGADLSGCAGRAYGKASGLEGFRPLVGAVQLAAFLALSQGMVAFEVELTVEGRERYLREELAFFEDVWEIYSDLLGRRLLEDVEQLDEALVDVEMCLGQAIFFYNYAIEYVKDNLDQCLNLNK